MPVVSIPVPYREPTGGLGEVTVPGASVRECLEAVEARHPGFLRYVLGPEGGVHRFVKLFVNGEPLEPASALATPVSDRDRVDLISAVAGG